MIKYAKYPEGLPLPSSNFSGTYDTPTVTTGFTSGKIRRRKIGRTSVKSATLEWLFAPDEFDLWESFYKFELEEGCVPFSIDMVSGGTSQTGEHVVQCVDDYSFSHEECNWRVSVPCRIYPYPSRDEGTLLESYLGYEPDPLFDIINKYYESEHV